MTNLALCCRLAAITWLALVFIPQVQAAPGAPFPAADFGFYRYMIQLPALANESEAKLELVVGKTLQLDCNRHSFSGQMVENFLPGVGYPYYRMPKIQGPLSTRMACPNTLTAPQFVAVNGQGFMLKYNSKLPVVVYLPQGFELRHRIWVPEPGFKIATPK